MSTEQLACQRIAGQVATTRDDYQRQWQTARDNARLDQLEAELTYLAPGDAVARLEAIRVAADDLVAGGAK